MKIDTLCFSGGSSKGCCYGGVFKALYENKIIDDSLNNIKHIFACSVSVFPCIALLLGYNVYQIDDFIIKLQWDFVFNYSDLDSLLEKNGLFESKCFLVIKHLLLQRGYSEHMTLLELYNKTNISFYVKVFNISKGKSVYMNHKNYPDMRLTDVTRMTTCIPFVFKPIEYKNSLYVDGGISGSIPIIQSKKFKHCLIIEIYQNVCIMKDDSIIDYCQKIINLISGVTDKKIRKHQCKNILSIHLNIHTLNFLLTNEDKKKLSNKAHKRTNLFIKNLQQHT
jgi:predicted acylesterase/phospholipase RssA